MTDRCEVPGCQGAIELIYLDRGICWTHWTELTADGVPASELRMALGLAPVASDAMEADMARKKIETTEPAQAAAAQVEATPTPAKKARAKPKAAAPKAPEESTTEEPAAAAEAAPAAEEPKKTRPRSKKTTAAEATVPETAPAPKKESPSPEPLVVFAFRLTQAERDAIHQTAGPRNATQFVRRVAVAFAREDKGAFETVIQEARRLRR